MQTIQLTADERKQINDILDRQAGLQGVLDATSVDYWRDRCSELRTEIEADTGEDPTALLEKILELEDASRLWASAKGGGELQPMRTIIKRKVEAVKGEVRPILTAASERAVVPLIDDADKAQSAQDADHKSRGLPSAPCPAAIAIREKAADILRRARGGDLTLAD